ncbi:MAG: c-type cytochrome domain-containing protein, partial [Planctomycetota bacterium]
MIGAFWCLLFAHGSLCAQAVNQEGLAATRVDFVRDVWPILSRNCLSCHGKEEQESGFRLDTREAALTSGDEHGPNVVPGQGSASNLVRFASGQVSGMQMPLAKRTKLLAFPCPGTTLGPCSSPLV